MMKILVIRFFHIGDVLLTSTLCNSLKKSFPDSQVDYLMYAESAPLFVDHPYIDNIISLDRSTRSNPFKYLLRIKQISNAKYDIVIDASNSGKSELISLFSRKSKFRIGRSKKGRGLSYTHRLAKHELSGNKIEQRLKLLQPLQTAGLPIVIDDQLKLIVSAQEHRAMRKRMREQGVDFNRPIIAFAVSSKLETKRWNQDHMLALTQHCIDHHGAQIVLFAGLKNEQVDIADFHSKANNHRDIFSTIGTDSLRELLSLFANCLMFIGNEGGPRHMAHAVGIPSVTILSPITEKDEWLVGDPQRHKAIGWRDIPSNHEHDGQFTVGGSDYNSLYNSITPDAVIPLIDEVMRNNTDSSLQHQVP